MRRSLLLVFVAAAVLAGCGTGTCTSDVGKLNLTTTSCTLAPVSGATVQVALCGRCNDSAPSCDAEFRNGLLDVGTTVQQCQENSGCSGPGCSSGFNRATCTVNWGGSLPSPGTYPLVVTGDTQVNGQVTIGGSGTTCQLL